MTTGKRDVTRMLASYSRPALETWAQARGLDLQRLRGPFLQQELARVLLSPTALKAALAEAAADERNALGRIKLEGGKVAAEELKAQLVIDGVKDPDAVLASLMSRGLLFYDRSMEGYSRWELWGSQQQQHYRPPLWLPAEISELVTIPDDLGHLPLEIAGEPRQTREGSFALLQRDIYLLLQAVRESPVKLLKAGGVGKRDWERLLKIVPATGAGENDPTAKARAEGAWVRFLWLLIQRAGLLAEEPGRLVVSPAGLQFLSQSEAQQALVLLRAWANMVEWNEFARVPDLEFEVPGLGDSSFDSVVMFEFGYGTGFGDVPSPPQLVIGRLTLMELILRQRPYPGWYSFASLLASVKRFRVNFLIPRSDRAVFMSWGASGRKEDRSYRGFYARGSSPRRRFHKDQDWEHVEGAYLRTLFEEPLLWLGIVRLGYVEGELVSFELTERGAAAVGLIEAPAAPPRRTGEEEAEREPTQRALVVQPNFEVVVYPDVAGIPLLVELDRFAERVRMDRAALYRLTRADLCRGLQGGLALADITRTLELHNAGPLPQNVAYSLTALRGLRRTEIVDYTTPITNALEFETATRVRVVPDAVTPRLLHRLKQIADPVEDVGQRAEGRGQRATGALCPLPSALCGNAATFELSREKISRAARWWRWEAMHAFLAGAARSKVPAELAVVLKAWAGQLAPAALTSTTLLAAPGADWLDQVMLVPEIRPLILHRLSPTLALVTEENRPRLEAALASIGVSTGAGASLSDLVTAAARAEADAGEYLLVGPPRKRRALLEQAIAERRRVVIAETTHTGRLSQTKLDPLRIDGEGASAALVARIEGYPYDYRYPLNRIQGVRMLDEPTKS
jgi:hypothetical protein